MVGRDAGGAVSCDGGFTFCNCNLRQSPFVVGCLAMRKGEPRIHAVGSRVEIQAEVSVTQTLGFFLLTVD